LTCLLPGTSSRDIDELASFRASLNSFDSMKFLYLSPAGRKYSIAVGEYVQEVVKEGNSLPQGLEKVIYAYSFRGKGAFSRSQ
jgi:hypothetical protein